jgi:hypothetical protein
MTGGLAALWWAKGRHYACFARAHENACRSDSAFQVIRKRNERPASWVMLFIRGLGYISVSAVMAAGGFAFI